MATHQHFNPAHIVATHDVADGIRLFDIRPDDGLQAHAPGSHIDVEVLVEDRPQYRSFSLIGDAAEAGAYRIAVKDRPDGHGGSRYLWSLEPGDRLRISDPKDRFPLSYRAPKVVLIAGGIGITPLYGMARALVQSAHDVRLLYTARTREEMAFVDELAAELGDRLELYVTGEGQRLDPAAVIQDLHPEAELYICGPQSLREAFLSVWLEQNRPAERFRFETFASSGRLPDTPFDVRVANRDLEFTVARDQSLLDALQAHGVNDVLYDCEHGECGLCTIDVVEHSGELDHRDVFYSPRQKAAGTRMCACVSRVHDGHIVIDTSRHAVDTGHPD
ncbi:PDR/VanB family oxidoreductase [Salinisphaera hydrothermalis]|uniref:Vanillate monooxygenase n=1 Tax=Salinisphaera hydrothermalis (strain C41B8) TaxID=1304275 RepID=A0A084IPJ9_SALHC|nr:PDR/VanB family oxidoreductase [Salinisphaera hydrothermalis]KEZ78633.1 vanillate monooxygenase [Salinisphaera hydrothermalis C41B8]